MLRRPKRSPEGMVDEPSMCAGLSAAIDEASGDWSSSSASTRGASISPKRSAASSVWGSPSTGAAATSRWNRNHYRTKFFVLLLFCSSLFTFLHVYWVNLCSRPDEYTLRQPSLPSHFARHMRGAPERKIDTLVVYVYSSSDGVYEDNMRYFIRNAVQENDGCEYVFIIQQVANIEQHMLPVLPKNSRYLFHANECYDWGSFGWASDRGLIEPSKYKYIILLNSSVRGPFLPAFWPREIHWSRVLTSRLNEEVKLVGSTISCEGTQSTDSHPARTNPHVQSYVVAMDQVAYNIMAQNTSIFKCYYSMWDTIYYSELGSSLAILEAGYNIDSLLLRYQGVDWRDTRNWNCNGGINPYTEDTYDGINLNPLEVMFVKVKEFMLQARWSASVAAFNYDRWTNQLTQHDLSSNAYLERKEVIQKVRMFNMMLRDPRCLDTDYYKLKNPDLPSASWILKDYWYHFVHHGQFEGRPWRFKCERYLLHSNEAVKNTLDGVLGDLLTSQVEQNPQAQQAEQSQEQLAVQDSLANLEQLAVQEQNPQAQQAEQNQEQLAVQEPLGQAGLANPEQLAEQDVHGRVAQSAEQDTPQTLGLQQEAAIGTGEGVSEEAASNADLEAVKEASQADHPVVQNPGQRDTENQALAADDDAAHQVSDAEATKSSVQQALESFRMDNQAATTTDSHDILSDQDATTATTAQLHHTRTLVDDTQVRRMLPVNQSDVRQNGTLTLPLVPGPIREPRGASNNTSNGAQGNATQMAVNTAPDYVAAVQVRPQVLHQSGGAVPSGAGNGSAVDKDRSRAGDDQPEVPQGKHGVGSFGAEGASSLVGKGDSSLVARSMLALSSGHGNQRPVHNRKARRRVHKQDAVDHGSAFSMLWPGRLPRNARLRGPLKGQEYQLGGAAHDAG